MDLSTLKLPRCKRAPPRLQIGRAPPEYPSTVQDHYRRIDFEVLDLLLAAIQERLLQKVFLMLHKLEMILILFYEADLCEERLKAQLTALHANDTGQSLNIL